MIRQMMRLAVEAFLVELEHWRNPTPPTPVPPVVAKSIAKVVELRAADEASAPWNMTQVVQEAAPAPKRRRRKAAAS